MCEVDNERKVFSCSRPALLRLTDLYRCKDFKIYIYILFKGNINEKARSQGNGFSSLMVSKGFNS